MAMDKPYQSPPDLFTDQRLRMLPIEVRWTAEGLRKYADDQGRELVNLFLLKAQIWPLEPEITNEVIEQHLWTLAELGWIGLYEVDGQMYYAMGQWWKVSHDRQSVWPPPPPDLFQKRSGTIPEGFPAEEREREERASAGERGESGPTRTIPEAGPSRYCPKHRATVGTPHKCQACANYREKAEAWERGQRAAAAAEAADASFSEE